MEGKSSARGITTATQWNELTNDGKIAVPYSLHVEINEFYYEAKIDAAMARLSHDIGCVEMVKVPHDELLTTSYRNGLMFTWSSTTGGGCWSALGLAPGFTGGNGDIEDLGAKPEWQIISLDGAGCSGTSEATLQHEVMHALGFYHEHQRPDRDDHIMIHEDNIYFGWMSQFTKLTPSSWVDSGHPFELGSVMTYCSNCAGDPAMTLLDGISTWGNFETGRALTTTDALQVQWHYCRDRPGYPYKNTMRCTGADPTGQMLEVFTDRLCDNVKDCFGGEDEGMGNGHGEPLAHCKLAAGRTINGCCSWIIMNGEECIWSTYYSSFTEGKDAYRQSCKIAYPSVSRKNQKIRKMEISCKSQN